MEDRAVIAFDMADGYNYVCNNLFHPPSVIIITAPEAFKYLTDLRIVYITEKAALIPNLPEMLKAMEEAQPGMIYAEPGFLQNPWAQEENDDGIDS